MLCKKCQAELSDDCLYCPKCGKKQTPAQRSRKSRGNGQGTVYKLSNGKYRAEVTLGYFIDDAGKRHRKSVTKTFSTKKEAVNALPSLADSAWNAPRKRQALTFKQLYDKWLPTHRASKSTIGCYKAAIKHFADIWYLPVDDIDIDDLQECIYDCSAGKRTRENMKALCSLLYKYGIPRRHTPDNLNLGEFLVVGGGESGHRIAFTTAQVEQIKNQIGAVPYADYVYSLIYLGFRPSEFLSLDLSNYNPEAKTFTGGAKTSAGINRIVTISPKIFPVIENIIADRTEGVVFPDPEGKPWGLKRFTEKAFYPVLEAAGIDNPVVDVGGGNIRHLYTPHCCRRTFATMMKNIEAPAKDKQALIGHASEEMLRYYQDVNVDDLRKITDLL